MGKQNTESGALKGFVCFLACGHPSYRTPGNKLRKVKESLASFKERCKLLYQSTQKLSVDECMVKAKHRSGIRQYMKKKPTKWGGGGGG